MVPSAAPNIRGTTLGPVNKTPISGMATNFFLVAFSSGFHMGCFLYQAGKHFVNQEYSGDHGGGLGASAKISFEKTITNDPC